ncbi:type VI secretion system tip protein VgrG [Adhaeribacter rhizoryzae]|uniref:Type VI secretion system tip protein VgrG n=1 Tax=Adhaeribacter rhizoryzae TaxID=2607907 RepID=A0A5M6DLW7_9BACT|nr:type VI secretion system tip protein VgrG [Adhaeribacter rhizoryzae]KAA5548443.1 type VI secretion system tip protein VgrG [Adhaeribacter rhizoryzae]
MNNSRTIPTAASPDVCTIKLLTDGTPISETYQIVSVVVSKEVNRIPTATITLLDGEPAAETFTISDKADFIPGKQIEIKAGYRAHDDNIFKGVVTKHSLKIRRNTSLLVIECKDKAVKMTLQPQSQYYRGQKDSQILEAIINRHGLAKEVEPITQEQKQLVQYNTTDWDFLVSRAELNSMLVLVDNGKVFVKKPDLKQQPVLVLQYGATLMELDAEIDTRLQFTSVEAKAWNPATQKIAGSKAQEPALNLNGNISPANLAKVFNTNQVTLKHSGQVNPTELTNWATAKLLKQRLAKIRGRLKCQGTHVVKPGNLIQVNGIGNRFRGVAFVSGVRHQIANGNWETDMQLGVQPEWFAHTLPIQNPELPFAGINGLQIGVVTQIEADPEGENRIKIRLPVISEDDEGVWARLATLDAGNKRGTFFRPEVNDEVVVGFLQTDPSQAIILGMCHSSALPTPVTAEKKNNEKGYVSRSGMSLIFNDEQKSVTLQTPNGNKIIVTETDKATKLEDQHGNKITMNQDGITLDSIKDITLKAAGNVKVEGMNIAATAQIGFKAEGGGGTELSAASGLAKVKGGMVMIN